jgi:hypothetical protein
MSTIARLPGEGPKPYEARCLYMTMGPNRTLARVGEALGKSEGLMERWSMQWAWGTHAATWDAEQQAVAAKRAAASYQRRLEQHRETTLQCSDALLRMGNKFLLELSKTEVKHTPGTLLAVAKAYTVALDMAAHALNVQELLDDHAEKEDAV